MGNRGAGKPWESENREEKGDAATEKWEPREWENREHRGTGTTELGSHRIEETGNQGSRQSWEPRNRGVVGTGKPGAPGKG